VWIVFGEPITKCDDMVKRVLAGVTLVTSLVLGRDLVRSLRLMVNSKNAPALQVLQQGA
jgi:hypothetical protein